MNPSKLRDQISSVSAEIEEIEGYLNEEVCRNKASYVPIRHELAEARDSVERALDLLDETYRELT